MLEAPRRAPIPIHRQRLALHGGRDEVGHGAPVVELHVRAVGIEDARDAHLDIVPRLEGVGEGLEGALALVVAGARAEAVDVAPVGLGLAADLGVAVDLCEAKDGVSRDVLRIGGLYGDCTDLMCLLEAPSLFG